MKTLILAVAMMMSAPSFAANILSAAKELNKCRKADDKNEFEEKIVGNTLCTNGKAYKIPTKYDEDEMVQITENGRPTGEYQFLEVYCFNKNFRDLRCRKFTKDTISIKDKLANSANSKVSGVTIDGTYYPACSSAAADQDGDSWGWENNKTCKVI